MSQKMLQTIALSAISSFAVSHALQTHPAQAAVLTYESELSVTSATQGAIGNAVVTFLKAPNAQPGLFDYTFQSFTASVLGTTYSQAGSLSPANLALAQSFSTFLPTEYQSRYQTLLSSVVSGTIPTYTGDGDFPPAAPLSYTFSGQDVSAGVRSVTPYLSQAQLSLVGTIAALFPNGGEATFSSTLIASTADSSGGSGGSAEGAPEPTTMAGLALAGAGMAAARRRLNKRKLAA